MGRRRGAAAASREAPPPIVFVGPSLARADAGAILAADYRPPVRRGDLEAIEGGRVVGIIDGVFDQELSISPSEIRAAVRRGVRVLGSSSMGALRASEVPEMVGVGHVYDLYRSGAIEDDDEVAIVFDPEHLRPLSEPMVNIRHAVKRLVSSGTLAKRDGAAIVRAAKRLPYRERVYPHVLRKAGLWERPDCEQLMGMLRSHDLKRDDAIALLERLPHERPERVVTPAATTTPAARRPAAAARAPLPADAPVFFWEFGDEVDFRALLRFMKLTGTFAGHARAAVARFVLEGNALSAPRRGSPSRRAALRAVEKRVGGLWDWSTEEDVIVTLRDLGLELDALYERFGEEVAAEEAVMGLAREGSDELLAAMRAELVMSELALKREAVRCASLERLAAQGREAGPPRDDELRRATLKLCERVDAVDAKTAREVLGWWGVAPSEVDSFIETLALARRVAETPVTARRARPRREVPGLELRRRLKVEGDKRFCVPLADAYREAERLARVVGVTRVAVITGLGDVGIPNAQAYRPGGRWSSTVGSGKSTSRVGAKVGAIMEEVETWAQEQFPGPDAPPEIEATFESLGRRRAVDPATLALPFDSTYAPDRPIGWRPCVDLLRGERILVPSAAIQSGRQKNDVFYSRHAGRKVTTTNGLASGFTLEEALTHAICEFVERDAETVATIGSFNPGCLQGRPLHEAIDLETVPASSRRLVDKIRAAGHRIVVLDITSDVAIPTFAAFILLDDPPESRWFGVSLRDAPGWATHPDPEVALNMAILEATQTILTNVSGAREDLTLHSRSLGRHERTRARTSAWFAWLRSVDVETKSFHEVSGFVSRDARADLEWIFTRLEAAGFDRLLVVDYTLPALRPARVVRVVIPGLETTNPFFVGLRPRLALLRDLLPPRRARRLRGS